MRPAGSPPMVMSKKTTGLDIASVGERRRVDRSKGLEKVTGGAGGRRFNFPAAALGAVT